MNITSTATAPSPLPEKPQPKSRRKVLLLGGAVVIILAAAIAAYFAFRGAQNVVKEADLAEEQLVFLLQLISDKKFEEAYALMSRKVQEAQPQEEFSVALSELEAHYSGFKNLSQAGFHVEKKSGQPTIYEYSGTVTYTDGDTGDIEATLVKEKGQWKIEYVYVEISAERLEKFKK